MKLLKSLLIVLLINVLNICSAQNKNEKAKVYYEKIKYENIIPCFNEFKEFHHIHIIYFKNAFEQEPKAFTKEHLTELNQKFKNLLMNLEKAINNITEIETLGDKTNLKDNSLIYLKVILEFEETSFKPILEIYEDGIKENEIEQIKAKLILLSRLEKASEDYRKIEIKFLKKNKISSEEVGVLNDKYGF